MKILEDFCTDVLLPLLILLLVSGVIGLVILVWVIIYHLLK